MKPALFLIILHLKEFIFNPLPEGDLKRMNLPAGKGIL